MIRLAYVPRRAPDMALEEFHHRAHARNSWRHSLQEARTREQPEAVWAGALARQDREGVRVQGMVAIVTGSGQGIGEATALRLAEEGANLVLADVIDAIDKVASDESSFITGQTILCCGGRSISSVPW